VRFPALRLAQERVAWGTAPAAINAADEILVEAFLAGSIPFPTIGARAGDGAGPPRAAAGPDAGAVLAADAWARRAARDFLDDTARTLTR